MVDFALVEVVGPMAYVLLLLLALAVFSAPFFLLVYIGFLLVGSKKKKPSGQAVLFAVFAYFICFSVFFF